VLIYKTIFNMYSRVAYLLSTMHVSHHQRTNYKRCELLLITVAYNDECLIEKQIELVRSKVIDPEYRHIVIDNSLMRKKRKFIKSVCMQHDIEYVAIPFFITFLFHYQIAISHGAALNWMYYHYLQYKKPFRFALLDHDLFPVRDVDMAQLLGQRDFYGVSRVFGEEWYLWPGFCVFNYDVFIRKPDFLPIHTARNFLDTGGGNYRRFYCKYDIQDVEFPSVQTLRIKNSKELTRRCDIYHSDYVQIIDDKWLHLINGSNYARIKGKDDFIKGVLADIGSFYSEISSKR